MHQKPAYISDKNKNSTVQSKELAFSFFFSSEGGKHEENLRGMSRGEEEEGEG